MLLLREVCAQHERKDGQAYFSIVEDRRLPARQE
jgi:hypothetical protein